RGRRCGPPHLRRGERGHRLPGRPPPVGLPQLKSCDGRGAGHSRLPHATSGAEPLAFWRSRPETRRPYTGLLADERARTPGLLAGAAPARPDPPHPRHPPRGDRGLDLHLLLRPLRRDGGPAAPGRALDGALADLRTSARARGRAPPEPARPRADAPRPQGRATERGGA